MSMLEHHNATAVEHLGASRMSCLLMFSLGDRTAHAEAAQEVARGAPEFDVAPGERDRPVVGPRWRRITVAGTAR
jgi:hypothetical protein